MTTQPIFLKLGINHPPRRTLRDRFCELAWPIAIAISVALNIYLLSQLRQSWKNERALCESVNQLTPKWP